jgi:xanthine/uracil/vitamin C permease (AzgA family)
MDCVHTPFPTVPLMLRVDSMLRERVYRAVAQKRPWYIRLFRSRCIATALHTIIRLLITNMPYSITISEVY